METTQTVLMPGNQFDYSPCISIQQLPNVVQCTHEICILESSYRYFFIIVYSCIAVELLFQYVQWELEGV